MPYTRITTPPYADEIINSVLDLGQSPLSKVRSDNSKGVFNGLGKQSKHEQALQNIIDKEGVIDLRRVSYDEL